MSRLAVLLAFLVLLGCPNTAGTGDATPADAPADAMPADVPFDVTATEDAVEGGMDVPTLDVEVLRDARSRLDDLEPFCWMCPHDAGMRDIPQDVDAGCEPGTTRACTCVNGWAGLRTCHASRVVGYCTCTRPPEADGGAPAPLPPRLVFPLSGMRVTSQRPTLRWVLPLGLDRARVELCLDRACTRSITRQEVAGASWRSPTTLSPGIVYWRVQGLAADGAIAWTSATWEFLVRHRDTPVDGAYGPIHDFNGDGFDDVVARGGWRSELELHVFQGSRSGLSTTATVLRSPEFETSATSHPSLGNDVAIGDLNGDGFADLVAAEPEFFYEPPTTSRESGHAHIYYGGADGIQASRTQRILVLAEPEILIENPIGSLHLETSFADAVGVTDFNGDGYEDVVAARWASNAAVPQAFLFLGSASGLRSTPADGWVNTRFAIGNQAVMRGVGDVDGDGYGDVVFGPSRVGDGFGITVFHGNPEGRFGNRLEDLDNPGFYSFGEPIYSGDFNGDGLADFVVGSWGWPQIFYGSASGIEAAPRLTVPSLGFDSSPGFGRYFQSQGDLNGDGFTDLSAGGTCRGDADLPSCACRHGCVYLYASSHEGVMTTWTRQLNYGGGVADFYYAAVPGDVNGDGIDDLVVGSPTSRRTGDSIIGGSIHLFLGGSWDWTMPTESVWSDQENLGLGWGVY